MAKLTQQEVLRYDKGRKRLQATVKRHYIKWREQQNPPIPMQCDNQDCRFFEESLFWNGKTLILVLDHINGVSGDNRPTNLRFLCPNCKYSQPTHGGSNRGKVIQDEGGFARKRQDGKKDYTLRNEFYSFAASDKFDVAIGKQNKERKKIKGKS